jgi:hypothetical protein
MASKSKAQPAKEKVAAETNKSRCAAKESQQMAVPSAADNLVCSGGVCSVTWKPNRNAA